MSELLRKLRARVDALIAPHVTLYGDDHPPVRMALLVLAEAEAIEAQLSEQLVGTERAAEMTGWTKETLQAHARAVLAGEERAPEWAGLQVQKVTGAYQFVVGSIPAKAAA